MFVARPNFFILGRGDEFVNVTGQTKNVVEVWGKIWGGLRGHRLDIKLGCNDKRESASCLSGAMRCVVRCKRD